MARTINMSKDKAEVILGLSGVYDKKKLKARYRELVKSTHPDVAGYNGMDVTSAEAKMTEINGAYQYLIHLFTTTGVDSVTATGTPASNASSPSNTSSVASSAPNTSSGTSTSTAYSSGSSRSYGDSATSSTGSGTKPSEASAGSSAEYFSPEETAAFWKEYNARWGYQDAGASSSSAQQSNTQQAQQGNKNQNSEPAKAKAAAPQATTSTDAYTATPHVQTPTAQSQPHQEYVAADEANTKKKPFLYRAIRRFLTSRLLWRLLFVLLGVALFIMIGGRGSSIDTSISSQYPYWAILIIIALYLTSFLNLFFGFVTNPISRMFEKMFDDMERQKTH